MAGAARAGTGGPGACLPGGAPRLRGPTTRQTVVAACATAPARELPAEAMLAGVQGFAGVEHRLEFVRRVGGADWYNDSIATAPERTLAALHSFEQPVVLLLGGRGKGLPWEPLFAELRRRVDHVGFFGELGPVMADKLRP